MLPALNTQSIKVIQSLLFWLQAEQQASNHAQVYSPSSIFRCFLHLR
jgi:hypothetical protein